MTIMTNIIVRHVLTQTMKMAYKMTQHEENSSICIIKSRLNAFSYHK